MISVFIGTNRPNSKSKIVGEFYYSICKELYQGDVNLFSLENLPSSILHSEMYSEDAQSPELRSIQEKYIIPADRWIFVVPEYNGSFPGVLKLFIDAISVKDYKATFSNKKSAIVGVSSGRSGNLRGLDHLTNCLNYVGTDIYRNKLPISSINSLISEKNEINQETKNLIRGHVQGFLEY